MQRRDAFVHEARRQRPLCTMKSCSCVSKQTQKRVWDARVQVTAVCVSRGRERRRPFLSSSHDSLWSCRGVNVFTVMTKCWLLAIKVRVPSATLGKKSDMAGWIDGLCVWNALSLSAHSRCLQCLMFHHTHTPHTRAGAHSHARTHTIHSLSLFLSHTLILSVGLPRTKVSVLILFPHTHTHTDTDTHTLSLTH